jgi:hypothetical protein
MKTSVMACLSLAILWAALPAILWAASATAQEFPDVVLRIEPEIGYSSDHVTLCRVRATNYSGHSISGASLGFEAVALEDGVVVERARGRFGGTIANGETAETLIGFNGAFRHFDVAPAHVSAKEASRRSGSGRRSASRKKGKRN